MSVAELQPGTVRARLRDLTRERAGLSIPTRVRFVGGEPVSVWLAGETSIVAQLRRYLLDEAGISRDETYEQEFNDSLVRFNDAAAAGEDTTDPDVLQRRAFDDVDASPAANGERP
jgi:hypothetical protein